MSHDVRQDLSGLRLSGGARVQTPSTDPLASSGNNHNHNNNNNNNANPREDAVAQLVRMLEQKQTSGGGGSNSNNNNNNNNSHNNNAGVSSRRQPRATHEEQYRNELEEELARLASHTQHRRSGAAEAKQLQPPPASLLQQSPPSMHAVGSAASASASPGSGGGVDLSRFQRAHAAQLQRREPQPEAQLVPPDSAWLRPSQPFPTSAVPAVASASQQQQQQQQQQHHSDPASKRGGGGITATITTTNTATAARPAKAAAPAPAAAPASAPAGSAPAAGKSTAAAAAADPNAFLAEMIGDPAHNNTTTLAVRTLAAPPHPAGRVIVVGDVHGCSAQLEALVAKVGYDRARDRLVIIGDYVNKGPDSVGVVRACQRLGAAGVLGNHDFTLLRCIDQQRRKPFTAADLRDPVKRLAKDFPPECEAYLRRLPHILRVPSHGALLVHAGLNVGLPLTQQDVVDVMHVRLLAEQPGGGKVRRYAAVAKGTAGADGEAWGSLWEGPELVIFGHDARSGFQLFPHAVGIDTGCVYGDPLTCAVLGPGGGEPSYVSVPGLPRGSNAHAGLPSPGSAVYEQDAVPLARLIIRPTSRATPSNLSFSAASAGAAAAAGASAGRGFPSAPAGPASPPSLAGAPPPLPTPGTAAAVAQSRSLVAASEAEAVMATLRALAAAGELSAVGVVLATPLYSAAVDALLADAAAAASLDTFWAPVTRALLAAGAQAPADAPRSARGRAREEALEAALGWCDELPALRAAAEPELRAARAACEAGVAGWSTALVKMLQLLL